jgi:hypothetical protein
MAVLQVLAEVICAEKLLGRIALAELVYSLEMLVALFNVLLGGISWHDTTVQGPAARAHARPGKVESAVTAGVSFTRPIRWVVKGPVVAWQGGARPGVPPHMQRVLVAFCLILVLESVATIIALILFLSFVCL